MQKFIGFALVLLVFSGISFSVNSVTGCTEINNNTDPDYQLVNNLVGANQSTFGGTACISISVSDVVLDCNGFSITDNGTNGSSIGIFSGGSISNITVQNCPGISNYTYGTYFAFTTSSLFTNLTAFDNGNGIFLGTGADNNDLSDSTVYNNSISGISVGSADNNTFTNNTALDNNVAGFDFQSNSGSTLTDNTAFSNNNTGFAFIVSSGNTLSGNNATDNANDGFAMTFSHSNSLSGNTASGNLDRAFEFANSTNNNLSGNTAAGGTSGFFFFSGSANNIVSGNNVSGTSGNAIFTGDNNILTGNIVSSSFQGISIGSNNVLSGNTVSGIAAFGGFRMESLSFNNVLTDNIAFNNNNRGLEILSANNTTVTNQHLYNNSVDLLIDGSGNVVTLSGIIFDSAGGSFSDYTNLSLSDIVDSTYQIDHSADPGSSPTAGHVSFANKFVSITNFTPTSVDSLTWHWLDSELTSFDENNFELWKFNGATWALQNDTPDTGANTLSLTDMDNFSVFGIFDTASDITGCQNISTPGNYVLANDLFGANVSGLPNFLGSACIRISVPDVLLDCNGFSITGNGGVTAAILAEGSGGAALANVLVENCEVSNYTQGFQVGNTTGSSFINNTAFDNVFSGFNVNFGSSGNFFTGNTAFGNAEHGFSLAANSDNNTLEGNIVHDNSVDGFHSDVSHGNTYQNNTAYGNIEDGIQLHVSSNNVVNGNSLFNNSYGVFVSSVSVNNALSSNNVTDNLVTGILIQTNPDGTILSGNRVSGNQFGVYVFEANNTAITNDHYFGNGDDFTVEGAGLVVALSGVVFDNSAGNFTDYTNLSLSDMVSAIYSINHAIQPAALPGGKTSFANKFLEIGNITGNESIDSATWHWLDSELANTSNESLFELWKHNGTWSKQNATLDTGANTLSLSPVNAFSTFAILQGSLLPPGGDGGDDGGDGAEDPLSVSLNSSLDGNVVTVTSGGSPLEGANVLVDGLSVGLTNSSGQVGFPGCSDTVIVKAKKSGYQDAEITATLVQCPACTTNDDCPIAMQCAENQCMPVSCACGLIQNHQCVAYQCCSDSQCGVNEQCLDHSCQPKESECASDGDCASAKYCDMASGSCKDVQMGACGQITDHKFVPYGYECGTEPGCPSCPSGQSCIDHQCAASGGDVNCPATGTVGSQVTCTATTNGQPCPLCDIEITGPDGKKSSVKTDQSGKFQLPLGLEGTYKVALLQDGSAVKTIQVNALPKTAGEAPPPTQASDGSGTLLLLLVLLLLIIGGVLYWRSRSAKK